MSEWISVDERFPDNCLGIVFYLAWVECPYYEGSVKVVAWHGDRFNGFPSGATKVTHWMPLPSPPEVE